MDKSKNYLYIPDNVLKEVEQDTFGHAHISDAVVQSIINSSPPFIIGIFGGWGTGKSSILSLIESELKKKHIPTVSIDAWQYSSTKSLKRAFLIHVANEIAPKLLRELRSRLYTTERESLPPGYTKKDLEVRKTIPEEFFFLFRALFAIILKFILSSVLFTGLLAIIFLFRSWISDDPIHNFDFVEVINTFLDLAFIPFVVALIDQLRPYISQEPIIVTHERIDADEMFSLFFDEVVNEAIRCKLPRNRRLVVFVDNLDRLSDEKMVEALEALKTYLNNENCIFVVACDDEVIRSVVESSDKVPRVINERTSDSEQTQKQVGEDYLEKFFQQTFRLPAYMDVDLFDFAEKQFARTKLFS